MCFDSGPKGALHMQMKRGAVFLYWMRLLGCFTLMQYIGVELLPIMDLASERARAFALRHGDCLRITAALPETAEGVSSLELVLVLVAVLFFTASIPKQAHLLFFSCETVWGIGMEGSQQFTGFWLSVKMSDCRAAVPKAASRELPAARLIGVDLKGGLVSENVAMLITMLSGGIGLGFQVGLPFFLCQLSIAICSMQSPADLWVNSKVGGSEVNGYLWFCKAKVAEEGNTQLESVHERLEEMTLGLVTREQGLGSRRKLIDDFDELNPDVRIRSYALKVNCGSSKALLGGRYSPFPLADVQSFRPEEI
ncbi:hypothetical protein AK812_SmicGene19391 [Symbiodinium microadriaticum]|uniref:Uncharacterized protein n=1 Tax=Symbiodinium microadriaticum TaxID=2951 RepID=A0A1Q9DSN8_SYMMI|nr:hypothetical protein AK812_SmicGene19391 [Symbiodinium microadriaticum]